MAKNGLVPVKEAIHKLQLCLFNGIHEEGLIAAHRNKTPLTDDIAAKIIELVEQSKGWSAVEASRDNAENVMMGIEEEIYNIPTVEYVHRRGGFMIMPFTVYHVAFHALADLRNIEMHKKHSVSSVVLGKDTFAVTVYPHVDYAFIVGLVVILDNQ